ncbi:MAG: SDR family oxidoreductase [Bacteroidetes bacterium]|nr:SDR family oxidoreductase [Bacteroidota bacterium]
MSKSSKVVWITGANKGIGAALTSQGAEQNFIIAATSRSNSIITSQNIHPFVCDVKSAESISRCYDEIIDELGKVDILINNAGVATFSTLWETSLGEADAMLNTNLRGMWFCTKTVLPDMINQKSGIIVNIQSVAAVKTFTNCSLYAATKAGALAMSRSLREEVREYGIKVIDIIPGATETDIWDSDSRNEFGSRMMQPSEIATIIWQSLAMSKDSLQLEEIVIRPQLGDL